MKTKTIILYLIASSLVISLYFYNNYTSVYMGGVLSLFSIYIAIVSTILALNALEITKKTLELTEKQQKIRDIEKKLDVFYYPLQDDLERLYRGIIVDRGEEEYKKDVEQLREEIKKDIDKIAPYRFFSEEKTRREFEKLRRDFPYQRDSRIKGLLDLVELDIKEYTRRINELNNSS